MGTAVLYLVLGQALYILEARVHALHLLSARWTVCTIGARGPLEDLELTPTKEWNSRPETIVSMWFGDNWARSGSSLGLSPLSIVSSADMNLVLDPRHLDFWHVKLIRCRPFQFDYRLFKAEMP